MAREVPENGFGSASGKLLDVFAARRESPRNSLREFLDVLAVTPPEDEKFSQENFSMFSTMALV